MSDMVYFEADNILSPLGITTDENINAMLNGRTGIDTVDDRRLYHEPFRASVIDDDLIANAFAAGFKLNEAVTRFEKMALTSIHLALKNSSVDITGKRTLLIFSTTKGNIDLLEGKVQTGINNKRVLLHNAATFIGKILKNPNPVMVISNACISGVLAINTAAMLIRAGLYDHAVVCGADMVTRFVVSGFMSFKSVSPGGCRPFDAAHDGLTLGEAAGTVILTNRKPSGTAVAVTGGASANDANHISGPSRTGEGSYIAIKKALSEAGKKPAEIDHISAHGTATPYNDEMESIALGRHNLEQVPVNSLKGYWGHTLGAAGIIETVALIHEMRREILLKTYGYEKTGVSVPINVIDRNLKKIQRCNLKMASGFGGCNAALILEKQE